MSTIINKLQESMSDQIGFKCRVVRDNPMGLNVVEVSVSSETYRQFDTVLCNNMDLAGFEVAFITKDDRFLRQDVDRYIVPPALGVGQILGDLACPQYIVIDKMLAVNHGLSSICLALEDTDQWYEQLVIVLDDTQQAANTTACKPGRWCEACPNSCTEYLGVSNEPKSA